MVYYKLRISYFETIMEPISIQDNLSDIGIDFGSKSFPVKQYDAQYRFVDQYLSLKSQSNIFLDQTPEFQKQCQQIKPKCQIISVYNEIHTPKIQISEKKGSNFHNFQKHLMSILKRLIKIKKTTNSSRSGSVIAGQLWEYFLRCRGGCKRTLSCLLMGRLQEGSLINKKKYDTEYQKIAAYLSQFSEKEISKGHSYLRRQICRQCRKILQSHSFHHLKISRQSQFENYFRMFLEDLQAGTLNQRVNYANEK